MNKNNFLSASYLCLKHCFNPIYSLEITCCKILSNFLSPKPLFLKTSQQMAVLLPSTAFQSREKLQQSINSLFDYDQICIISNEVSENTIEKICSSKIWVTILYELNSQKQNQIHVSFASSKITMEWWGLRGKKNYDISELKATYIIFKNDPALYLLFDLK